MANVRGEQPPGEAIGQLTGWLSILAQCESRAGSEHTKHPGEDLETVLLMLNACRADVMVLLERIEQGETLDDAETDELLLILEAEIASLKARLLSARVRRRLGAAVRDRVRARDAKGDQG